METLEWKSVREGQDERRERKERRGGEDKQRQGGEEERERERAKWAEERGGEGWGREEGTRLFFIIVPPTSSQTKTQRLNSFEWSA